jgi:adenine-specific DNA-methyltransferase
MHEQVPTQVEAPVTLKYPRNADLDPQLVWRGKDSQDLADLRVDAPPIYIQEKIDPAVLIENLRDTANAGEIEPELTLFEGFDGLPQSELVDFYQHSANWSNRMILGDSLQVMASLAEREMLRGKVQMIYMDPPYGIKFGSNWQLSMRVRTVRDGNLAEFAQEPEVVKAFRDTWELGIHSYLSYLRDRMTIARDLLTSSGSIFLQIGQDNVHLVRNVMDEVFGPDNFVVQICFKKTSSSTKKTLASVNDYIIWYARDKSSLRSHGLFRESACTKTAFPLEMNEQGQSRRRTDDTIVDGWRPFRTANITSQGGNEKSEFPVELDGHVYLPSRGTHWKTNKSGMARLKEIGRLHGNGRTLSYIRFFDDFELTPLNNFWDDTIQSTFAIENIYVVQTYSKVIARCLLMATKPGDLVIDPTCGSGTTAFVAEQYGRRWITIDSSRVALTLARERLMASRYPLYRIKPSIGNAVDGGVPDVRNGFEYHTATRITLKSLVHGVDDSSESDDETGDDDNLLNQAILLDKPIENGHGVRVSGPFTLESLTPHRSLELPVADSSAPEPKGTVDGIEFDQVILQNVRTAGIQNGLRKERIEFSDLAVHAGRYIQGVGTPKEGGENKVAIAVGPQYGTVSPQWIQSAAVEAKTIPGVRVLAVLGFAFDPQVRAVTDQYEANDSGINTVGELPLGKLRVLMVRMNPDLLMGRDLRKTASANLFMVFGEPEVIWKRDDEKIVVEVKGVDVYDPIKDEIRSRSTDQIYLWMIDTNYDGKSFFMRHCYFLGEQEPYEKLKRDLKADIDEEVWETLYKTTSRPFDPPSTGRIAVKVINDYGDEAMKVIEIK